MNILLSGVVDVDVDDPRDDNELMEERGGGGAMLGMIIAVAVELILPVFTVVVNLKSDPANLPGIVLCFCCPSA